MTTANWEQRREWRSKDKSDWPSGPWMDEPDKVQWVEPETGLDCMVVRGPAGALCGYVGVPESHPWHGKDYTQCLQSPPCEESWCGHTVSNRMDVHGGLTFADSCDEPTEAEWLSLPQKLAEAEAKHANEARRFPRGDAARLLARLRAQQGMTFADWFDARMAERICHLPSPGRPGKVWWFGFDCAHYMDATPASGRKWRGDDGDVYRTLAYVRDEAERLARQLGVLCCA